MHTDVVRHFLQLHVLHTTDSDTTLTQVINPM